MNEEDRLKQAKDRCIKNGKEISMETMSAPCITPGMISALQIYPECTEENKIKLESIHGRTRILLEVECFIEDVSVSALKDEGSLITDRFLASHSFIVLRNKDTKLFGSTGHIEIKSIG